MMCRQCDLVRQVMDGIIKDEHVHLKHSYFVIIDDPLGKDVLVIHKDHRPDPLQIFIDTMVETAEDMFPDRDVYYNKANPPFHFYFKMKLRKRAKEKKKEP